MAGMAGMAMAGGEPMSMMWTRIPGQTWPGAAASFLGMWTAMMVAMMLPSLVPMLWRYHGSVGRAGVAARRGGWLTAVVGAGYLVVWIVLGAAVFPFGVALSAATMRHPTLARMLPFVAAAVVTMAGALQFTAWKSRRLSCRNALVGRGGAARADAGTAWRHGMHLGVDCAQCCVGLMAIPLAVGIMDLSVMAAVAAAITAERLAPAGVQVARAIGVVGIGAGMLLMVRATGLG
jgi:predicted metal-binding membrane protein